MQQMVLTPFFLPSLRLEVALGLTEEAVVGSMGGMAVLVAEAVVVTLLAVPVELEQQGRGITVVMDLVTPKPQLAAAAAHLLPVATA